VYADLGSAGTFISALVGIVALKVSRSRKSAPDHPSDGGMSASNDKGMNANERIFMSELMGHMAANQLVPYEVEQINEVVRTLGEARRDTNITNVYHPLIAPSIGNPTNGEQPSEIDPAVEVGQIPLPSAPDES
jgi:hypothetical protein